MESSKRITTIRLGPLMDPRRPLIRGREAERSPCFDSSLMRRRISSASFFATSCLMTILVKTWSALLPGLEPVALEATASSSLTTMDDDVGTFRDPRREEFESLASCSKAEDRIRLWSLAALLKALLSRFLAFLGFLGFLGFLRFLGFLGFPGFP